MSATALEVSGVSKRYEIGHLAKADTLVETLAGGLGALRRRLRGRRLQREEFWALRDVGFSVETGEIVGIVGRNGAGKSTLLKILSRITEPTTGRISLHGRVASLLEVGTGFHPELSGRENIFLNGAILGMSRAEIRRKFDEIVAFSEVERFIDTPVKRYSSGMYVRLAFSVAAHLDPEILIVDEVLAVGDASFQRKCLGKVRDVSRGGRTALLVSHNLGVISSLCNRCVWLDQGRLNAVGGAGEIVRRYLAFTEFPQDGRLELAAIERPAPHAERLRITAAEWLDSPALVQGRDSRLRIHFEARQEVSEASLAVGFSRPDGTRLLTYETDYTNRQTPRLRAGQRGWVEFTLPSVPLSADTYLLDLGAKSGLFHDLDYLPGCAQVEIRPGPDTHPRIVKQGWSVRLDAAVRWGEGGAA